MKRIRTLTALLLWLSLLPALALGQETEPDRENIPSQVKLLPLSDGIYQVEGMRRLVESTEGYAPRRMAERVQAFNEALDRVDRHIPTYVYYVENSRSHSLKTEFPEESPQYVYLKENLHADGFDHLKYATFREYCDYFYTTDHHWNYRGSYQGYVDIVRMLKGPDEPVLTPSDVLTLPVYYNGAYCRRAKPGFSREYFTVYRFDPLPAYTAWVKGRQRAYDRMEAYWSGAYSTASMANHYGLYYGGDSGKLVMEGESEGKGTLLLFGDSMSNAVKTLLIHHYDRIVCVDLRNFLNDEGKYCSLRELLREYPVDQILFLGNTPLFMTGDLIKP